MFDANQRHWSMEDFIGVLDVFIALPRSEGYGLQIAEAAQAGVNVLATGWRLAPDIAARPQVHTIDYKLVEPIDPQNFYDQFPGAIWADPDLDHAAKTLRMLRGAARTNAEPE